MRRPGYEPASGPTRQSKAQGPHSGPEPVHFHYRCPSGLKQLLHQRAKGHAQAQGRPTRHCSYVVSDSLRLQGLQPARLLC